MPFLFSYSCEMASKYYHSLSVLWRLCRLFFILLLPLICVRTDTGKHVIRATVYFFYFDYFSFFFCSRKDNDLLAENEYACVINTYLRIVLHAYIHSTCSHLHIYFIAYFIYNVHIKKIIHLWDSSLVHLVHLYKDNVHIFIVKALWLHKLVFHFDIL